MKINKVILTRLRECKPWSQGELAIAAGLSLRTIQRAERDGNVSLETKKALASALDVDVRVFEKTIEDTEPYLVRQLLDMQNANTTVPEGLLGEWEGDYYGTMLTLHIDNKVITPKGPIGGASPYAFRNNLIVFGLNGRIQAREVTIINPDKMSFKNLENNVTVEFNRVNKTAS